MSELDSVRKQQLDDLLRQLNKAEAAAAEHTTRYPASDIPLPFRPEVEAVVNRHLKQTSRDVESQKDDALLRNILIKNESGLELSPEEKQFMLVKKLMAGEPAK